MFALLSVRSSVYIDFTHSKLKSTVTHLAAAAFTKGYSGYGRQCFVFLLLL